MHQGRESAWREGAQVKPKGGFRFITVAQLTMGWWAYQQGHIKLRDLRAWFACHEVLERRCMLERGRKPSFTFGEVQRITGSGGGERHTAVSIRRLQRVGLLTWSSSKLTLAVSPEQLRGINLPGYWEFLGTIPNRKRKVPVPRQILRLLAGGARGGVIATTLGHMLKGLFYRSGACSPNGAVTTSWIAETFGVGEATVKHARAHLVELGILEPQPTHQNVMNRIGRWFRFNLEWERPSREQPVAAADAESIVDNSVGGKNKSTPPVPVLAPSSTPPIKNRDLPTGAKNQKPGSTRASGFLTSKGGGQKKPSLRNVVREDLGDIERLLELFAQAAQAKLVDGSDLDRLRFVGAAEHARTIGSVNPPGLFSWLIRNRRWSYVTDGDEDSANQRIKRHLYGDTHDRSKESFRPKPRNPFADLSDDARLVKATRDILARKGVLGNPFSYVRRARPEWTRERWDAAAAEFDRARIEQARMNARVDTISTVMEEAFA